MKHLLGTHFEDHIWVSAHPYAAHCDLAQQLVKVGTIAPIVNRIDPDKHAIERRELCADGVKDIVLIDDRFRIDANIGKRREHGLEPVGLWRGTEARRLVAPPEDRDAA